MNFCLKSLQDIDWWNWLLWTEISIEIQSVYRNLDWNLQECQEIDREIRQKSDPLTKFSTNLSQGTVGKRPTNICGQASSKMLPLAKNRGLGHWFIVFLFSRQNAIREVYANAVLGAESDHNMLKNEYCNGTCMFSLHLWCIPVMICLCRILEL